MEICLSTTGLSEIAEVKFNLEKDSYSKATAILKDLHYKMLGTTFDNDLIIKDGQLILVLISDELTQESWDTALKLSKLDEYEKVVFEFLNFDCDLSVEESLRRINEVEISNEDQEFLAEQFFCKFANALVEEGKLDYDIFEWFLDELSFERFLDFLKRKGVFYEKDEWTITNADKFKEYLS